jgi:hypothetical protein
MTITPIAWRMIYRLMDNVKSVMDDVYEDKNGEINYQQFNGFKKENQYF